MPVLSFARFRGRECLRIKMTDDVVFYDGEVAWRIEKDVRVQSLTSILKNDAFSDEGLDAIRAEATDFGAPEAPDGNLPEPGPPAPGNPARHAPSPADPEPEVSEEGDVDFSPDW